MLMRAAVVEWQWRISEGANAILFFTISSCAGGQVTSVQDALALWQNMQEREKGGFKPEQDEEFEDAEGNVYNRKTYEDLRRQGLI